MIERFQLGVTGTTSFVLMLTGIALGAEKERFAIAEYMTPAVSLKSIDEYEKRDEIYGENKRTFVEHFLP